MVSKQAIGDIGMSKDNGRGETELDTILSKFESEIYKTMETIQKTLGVSSEYSTELVRDFLKERF